MIYRIRYDWMKRNAVNMDISACSLCKLKNVDCVISLIHVLMCISYK